MKRLLVILFFCSALLETSYAQHTITTKDSQFPLKPLGWTSDFEHIFSDRQVAELDSIISRFEKETTNEIAIITLDSSYSTKAKFDSMILVIANQWGVGKENLNNGIVIGLSRSLGKIRIINGYGIEPRITGNDTQKIINEVFIPAYSKGKFYEGTKAGLLTIIQLLTKK
jgi:uncharacterized protein